MRRRRMPLPLVTAWYLASGVEGRAICALSDVMEETHLRRCGPDGDSPVYTPDDVTRKPVQSPVV